MPRIKNITEIADPTQPAAEGNYTVEIVAATDEISKNTNAEMIRVQLRITAAEDSENESHVGKTFFDYVVYGGDAPSNYSLWRLRQYATAAGLDPADFDTEALVGTELDAYVKVREGDEQYGPSNQIGRLLVDVD